MKCKEYLEHPETAGVEEWAAYESRIRACALVSGSRLAVSYTHLDVYKRQVFHLRIPKYRDEKSVSKGMGMSCLWYKA